MNIDAIDIDPHLEANLEAIPLPPKAKENLEAALKYSIQAKEAIHFPHQIPETIDLSNQFQRIRVDEHAEGLLSVVGDLGRKIDAYYPGTLYPRKELLAPLKRGFNAFIRPALTWVILQNFGMDFEHMDQAVHNLKLEAMKDREIMEEKIGIAMLDKSLRHVVPVPRDDKATKPTGNQIEKYLDDVYRLWRIACSRCVVLSALEHAFPLKERVVENPKELSAEELEAMEKVAIAAAKKGKAVDREE